MTSGNSKLSESVKTLIRSVLLTEKNGLTPSQLQGIYSEFIGGTIPFKQLGFSSLNAYLNAIPDAAKPRSDGTYMGVANEETQHIQRLVSQQKNKKKKPRISRRCPTSAHPVHGRSRGGGRGSYRGSSRGGRVSSRGGGRSHLPQSSHPPAKQQLSRGSRPPANPPPSANRQSSREDSKSSQPRQPSSNLQNGSQVHPPPHRRPSNDNNNQIDFQARPPRGRGKRNPTSRDVPPRFRKGSTERTEPEEPHDDDIDADDIKEVQFHRTINTPPPNTSHSEEIEAMNRIEEILDERSNGVYMTDIPKVYKEKFQDTVDLDLIDKMAALDLCHKERIIDDHFIIYKKLTVTAPRNRFAPREVVEKTMERNVTTLKAPTSLPELTIPDEEFIEVLVSLIHDTSHFYCYMVGEEYSEKLRDLEDRMLSFYADEEQLQLEGPPEIGSYYAVRSEKDWLRAQVVEVYDGLALCRLADHGDREEIELSDIRHLPKRFCTLPEQAVLCSLANSPLLPNTERIILAFCRFALSREVTARILKRCDPLRVVLYNETRCINDILMNILLLDRPE